MVTPPASALLSVRNLAKRYPGGAGVHDVSFSIRAGEVTGFIGVNGSGKSTTLRCVLGLLQPAAGEILLFGKPANGTLRRRIGFLPEERGLTPHDRARDAIAFQARLKGIPKRDALRRADQLLERIGLAGKRRARIEELSKGNAQRIQILCALSHNPDLLILDEPLTGLDPIGQGEMLSLFTEFAAEGAAVLFSTHSMAAAQSICDQVVMISAGRTVFEGPLSLASEQAPHGAVVVTPDGPGLMAAAAAVEGHAYPMTSAIGDAARWRVVLPRHVPHPALVRALSERAVVILAFEPIKADLEGAFWQLAAGPPGASPRNVAA